MPRPGPGSRREQTKVCHRSNPIQLNSNTIHSTVTVLTLQSTLYSNKQLWPVDHLDLGGHLMTGVGTGPGGPEGCYLLGPPPQTVADWVTRWGGGALPLDHPSQAQVQGVLFQTPCQNRGTSKFLAQTEAVLCIYACTIYIPSCRSQHKAPQPPLDHGHDTAMEYHFAAGSRHYHLIDIALLAFLAALRRKIRWQIYRIHPSR